MYSNRRRFVLFFGASMALLIAIAAIKAWLSVDSFASEMVRVGLFGIPLALVMSATYVIGRSKKEAGDRQ